MIKLTLLNYIQISVFEVSFVCWLATPEISSPSVA